SWLLRIPCADGDLRRFGTATNSHSESGRAGSISREKFNYPNSRRHFKSAYSPVRFTPGWDPVEGRSPLLQVSIWRRGLRPALIPKENRSQEESRPRGCQVTFDSNPRRITV